MIHGVFSASGASVREPCGLKDGKNLPQHRRATLHLLAVGTHRICSSRRYSFTSLLHRALLHGHRRCSASCSEQRMCTGFAVHFRLQVYRQQLLKMYAFLLAVQAHQKGRNCRQVRHKIRCQSQEADQEDRSQSAQQVLVLLLWQGTPSQQQAFVVNSDQ